MRRPLTLTQMSRTGALPPLTPPQGRARRLASCSWRAFCISILPMLNGCYFFLPFIEVTQNVPPTIDFSSPADGSDLVFRGEQETAFVIATDEDGDNLNFVWTLEGHGIQADAVPLQAENYQASQLAIQRHAEYDGRVLSVSVYDPQGDSARLSWTIEIPEGSP